MRLIIAAMLSLLLHTPVYAANFYVDPVSGDDTNNGSISAPWKNIQQIFYTGKVNASRYATPYTSEAITVPINPDGAVHAGDTICLMDGYHGAITIDNYVNQSLITISSCGNFSPQVEKISFKSSSRWLIEGLSISESYAPEYTPTTMVLIQNHGYTGPSSHITVKNSTIFSVPNNLVWGDLETWHSLASGGISSQSNYTVVDSVNIYNVANGVFLSGDDSAVENSIINNFSVDGVQYMGSRVSIIGNLIKNSNHVSTNHDDLIQAWNTTAAKVGGVIAKNRLIYNDGGSRFPSTSCQGIFLGDIQDGLIIENNVVVPGNLVHGISVQGASNCKVANNTVIGDVNLTDGISGSGNLVINNLANAFSIAAEIIAESYANIIINQQLDHFINPERFVFSLTSTSSAKWSGSIVYVPTSDIMGTPRTIPLSVGAYEYKNGSLHLSTGDCLRRADGSCWAW